jgi:hypothetical protein
MIASIIVRAAALAALLLLCGCAAPAIGLGAAAGAAQIPTWLATANEVITGVKTLTATEEALCGIQSEANARGDARLSYWAGLGCVY